MAFGATVKVDTINIDSYLPTDGQAATPPPAKPAEAPTASDGSAEQTTASPKPAQGRFAALAPLTEFDANVNVSVQNLTASGVPMRDIKADIGLLAGDLTVRNVSVGNVVGVSSALTGALHNLGGVPEAKALKTDVKIIDLEALAKFVGAALPIPAKDIGSVSMTATVDGALTNPSLDTQVQTLDATLNARGTVSHLNWAVCSIW